MVVKFLAFVSERYWPEIYTVFCIFIEGEAVVMALGIKMMLAL